MKFKLFPYHHIRWGGASQIFARTPYCPSNKSQRCNAFWRSADARLILVTRHCCGCLSDIPPIIFSPIEVASGFTQCHEGWFLIQSPDFCSSSRQTQKVAAQSMSFRYPWQLPRIPLAMDCLNDASWSEILDFDSDFDSGFESGTNEVVWMRLKGEWTFTPELDFLARWPTSRTTKKGRKK